MDFCQIFYLFQFNFHILIFTVFKESYITKLNVCLSKIMENISRLNTPTHFLSLIHSLATFIHELLFWSFESLRRKKDSIFIYVSITTVSLKRWISLSCKQIHTFFKFGVEKISNLSKSLFSLLLNSLISKWTIFYMIRLKKQKQKLILWQQWSIRNYTQLFKV